MKKRPKKVYPDPEPKEISILWAATNMSDERFDVFMTDIKRKMKMPKKMK